MVQRDIDFNARLERIRSAPRNRAGRGLVLRSDDGRVSAQRRLLFAFPLRGLILAFVILVAVKAYLVWFLGLDLYQAAILELLSGTGFERAAARILMPDQLTMWVVGAYDGVAALVSGGVADL